MDNIIPMGTFRINRNEKGELYFCTLTLCGWYYIFDRHDRFRILADNLAYCQRTKGLKIYAYVFMLNHIHLIASANDLAGVLRDFKSFTAKELSKNICAFEPQILRLFQTEKGFHFWQNGNEPKMIETEKFLHQKLTYIHNNPVKKEYVNYPEEWRWSSANEIQEIIKVSDIPY